MISFQFMDALHMTNLTSDKLSPIRETAEKTLVYLKNLPNTLPLIKRLNDDLTEIEEKDIEQYFLDLFCGKEDTMQVVLNILKSCLTGETLRYIYFFTGSGCNGKSLLFNILNLFR